MISSMASEVVETSTQIIFRMQNLRVNIIGYSDSYK